MSRSPELPEPLDVIAVGAHPDDVEIAVGGTLAKLVKQGYRVGLVDLTNGEPTPGSSGPDQRAEEARNAAKVLGLHMRETLTLPNRWLFDSVDSRIALARVFRRYRPKIVMGIADKTPMASPDHWQAMQITDAAIFYSRLTKWDEEFEYLPPHRISKHVWYPLGFQTLHIPDGGGQIVTDISDTLEQKLESIRCYQSQFPPEKERVFTMVESHNRMLGYSAGFEAGELLITATTLGIKDLVQTLTG
ncbi:MAG: PIG-L family deacetylase [Planctomycetaceae bacterium]|jgi:N-acetylglucosamine malate deacetylase 1|nr:PIG-L family deacetylase [bacterium]MDC0307890.1 PIG-L family deacetylase [Planctomycetaceae bacterium]MDG2390788.1 PIG-L family deacetylase [Planctomycetaceae bacterium]